MREYQINQNDSAQRVDKFLFKTLPKLPKSLLYKYIRNKKIKVNRQRCEISQRLQEGDTIQLYIAEEFFEVEKDRKFLQAKTAIDIVYEDEHLLLVNKPAGLLAHSDQEQVEDNLIDRIKHYLYQHKSYDPDAEQSFAPALCHRIDRNTQGLVIAAKDAMSLRLINQKIREGLLDKYYLCIVEGHLPKPKDTITLYHKKRDNNIAQISKYHQAGYKPIKTGYQVLKRGKMQDLVRIVLYSGKSHQIRATMAYIGHPLVSDVKYGAKKTDYPYQALCSYQVTFHFSEEEPLFYLNEKTFELKNTTLQDYFDKKCR